MAVKYKLYSIEENGKIHEEFYTKKELEQHRQEVDENLFECAEHMVFAFNSSIKRRRGNEQPKRFAYKLEKISVNVIGSEPYYGLNVSSDMCEPEFK